MIGAYRVGSIISLDNEMEEVHLCPIHRDTPKELGCRWILDSGKVKLGQVLIVSRGQDQEEWDQMEKRLQAEGIEYATLNRSHPE